LNSPDSPLTSDPVTIQEALLVDLERPGFEASQFHVEGSALERVRLPDARFGSLTLKDVRLTGCDLANVRAHRMTLARVEFIDCRLTGFIANALDCRDVLIRNGDLSYSQLPGGTLQTCEFNSCNFREADLQRAILTGAIFRSCDLSRADLRGAMLRDADFRGSEVEQMVVGINDLRGAIVDPAQAMVLARLLGLQIRGDVRDAE
jgi:uncharacterized protein YjbI with pentapeptide repeats